MMKTLRSRAVTKVFVAAEDREHLLVELKELQCHHQLAEALLTRNEAQLMSFIDEEHQWESMEEEERELLEKRFEVSGRIDEIEGFLGNETWSTITYYVG